MVILLSILFFVLVCLLFYKFLGRRQVGLTSEENSKEDVFKSLSDTRYQNDLLNPDLKKNIFQNDRINLKIFPLKVKDGYNQTVKVNYDEDNIELSGYFKSGYLLEGVIKINNKTFFSGQLINGLPNGQGVSFQSGFYYVGEFFNGWYYGQG